LGAEKSGHFQIINEPMKSNSKRLTVVLIVVFVGMVEAGNQISAAIHGEHFVRGLAFNIHTYQFDRENDVELPVCPQGERAVLNELVAALKNMKETNTAATPD
jgi:hypothetical protein